MYYERCTRPQQEMVDALMDGVIIDEEWVRETLSEKLLVIGRDRDLRMVYLPVLRNVIGLTGVLNIRDFDVAFEHEHLELPGRVQRLRNAESSDPEAYAMAEMATEILSQLGYVRRDLEDRYNSLLEDRFNTLASQPDNPYGFLDVGVDAA